MQPVQQCTNPLLGPPNLQLQLSTAIYTYLHQKLQLVSHGYAKLQFESLGEVKFSASRSDVRLSPTARVVSSPWSFFHIFPHPSTQFLSGVPKLRSSRASVLTIYAPLEREGATSLIARTNDPAPYN